MIKFVMCLKRNAAMSREEFRDYWLNNHGPFFQKNAGVMKAKKYVQSHILETPVNDMLRQSRNMIEPYDGVAEVWFDSVEDFTSAMSTPEGQKLGEELLTDESKFVDHANSTAFFVEEHAF